MIKITAEDKITKAKVWIALRRPFFAVLMYKLRFAEHHCAPYFTAMTDGTWFLWNRDYIDSLTPEQTVGLVCHEVMHCASRHHTRRGTRQKMRWNHAGDYVINWIIQQDGIQLPPGGLIEAKYANLSTEHVYEMLPEDLDQPKQPQGGPGEGEPSPGGVVVDAGSLGDPNADAPGQGKGEQQGQGKAMTQGQKDAIRDQQDQDWSVAVQQATEAAKAKGDIPGHLQRFVDHATKPKVPWREKLRNFATNPMRGDYTFMRGNRRHLYLDMYLPSNYQEGLGVVVLAVDTSGSIGDKELSQFESELNCILEDNQPEEVIVLYVDTRVAGVQRFTPDQLPVKIEARGGGGTEFDPPFHWVEENQVNPACFIYLTDLWGTCSVPPPPYPTLWVTTAGQTEADIPFGTLTHLEI